MAWYEFALVQIAVLITVYSFFRWQNKREKTKPQKVVYNDDTELCELNKLRSKSLSVPLSEIARPKKLEDIIGQENAVMALRAALCGKNPQHVIIYGPPGVGKTCAARLLLEEAKKARISPFNESSKFIEIDATCVRFDERAIADPLLGCVHDPIYQGAGALGVQGIPQPKPGAVTHAHCGVLFLDEIGELHPLQMNKLLKVLEDRRVFFESSYYSKSNRSIPTYIHDIFRNGLPADFRLVGATTRSPEELPSALRSRCVEIFFSHLNNNDLIEIARRAAGITGLAISEKALELCASFCTSGRDCVNMIQLAGGLCNKSNPQRNEISCDDIEWVAATCRYTQKYVCKLPEKSGIGTAFGVGVAKNTGLVLEIECTAQRVKSMHAGKSGVLTVNGAVCEEEIETHGRKLKRTSLVYASAQNVLCAVSNIFKIDCRDYDITFNIPGGLPVDGPSAGVALCCALVSALTKREVLPCTVLTGEVTQSGEVRAVGGIRDKVLAAAQANALHIFVPTANLSEAKAFSKNVIGVSNIRDLVKMSIDINRSPAVTVQTNLLHDAL